MRNRSVEFEYQSGSTYSLTWKYCGYGENVITYIWENIVIFQNYGKVMFTYRKKKGLFLQSKYV